MTNDANNSPSSQSTWDEITQSLGEAIGVAQNRSLLGLEKTQPSVLTELEISTQEPRAGQPHQHLHLLLIYVPPRVHAKSFDARG